MRPFPVMIFFDWSTPIDILLKVLHCHRILKYFFYFILFYFFKPVHTFWFLISVLIPHNFRMSWEVGAQKPRLSFFCLQSVSLRANRRSDVWDGEVCGDKNVHAVLSPQHSDVFRPLKWLNSLGLHFELDTGGNQTFLARNVCDCRSRQTSVIDLNSNFPLCN